MIFFYLTFSCQPEFWVSEALCAEAAVLAMENALQGLTL
jgi:hypothetical protein